MVVKASTIYQSFSGEKNKAKKKTLPIEADHNKATRAFITFLQCIFFILKTKLNNRWELHKATKRREEENHASSFRTRLASSSPSPPWKKHTKSLIIDLKTRFYLHLWLNAITHESIMQARPTRNVQVIRQRSFSSEFFLTSQFHCLCAQWVRPSRVDILTLMRFRVYDGQTISDNFIPSSVWQRFAGVFFFVSITNKPASPFAVISEKFLRLFVIFNAADFSPD